MFSSYCARGNRFLALPLSLCIVVTLTILAPATPTGAQFAADYAGARRRMVQQAVINSGVTNERVIDAMGKTPRHAFVPPALRERAYEDMALPIGDAQTISSPFIVAFMTEVLDPQPGDRVLEIGTGSGYQAAVLSFLVQDVYTIEIVESLGKTAGATLQQLGYRNVHTKIGDGFQGWPEHAPFDKIIVTCSPENVPQPLVDQLKEDGRLVIPVGRRYQQTLYVMRKAGGRLERVALRPTLFVPMTGTAEANRQVQPDPLNPVLHNAGFEKAPLETGFVPDWYYQRQARRVTDSQAPQGNHYLRITNQEPGKPGIAMQGFPIDGRQISRIEVSGWVRHEAIRRGQSSEQLPAIVISFYDDERAMLGLQWLGPFRGDADWRQQRKTFRVPPQATEAIVRIGLFGAVGQIDFDHVRLRRIGP